MERVRRSNPKARDVALPALSRGALPADWVLIPCDPESTGSARAATDAVASFPTLVTEGHRPTPGDRAELSETRKGKVRAHAQLDAHRMG